MVIQRLLIVLGIFAAAVPVAAADIAGLAAEYGAREAAWRMRLSPSGDKVLYFTAARSQGTAVVVADVATGATTVILSSEKATVVPYDCDWKSEKRVICSIYLIREMAASEMSFRRSLSIAVDGSSRIELGQRVTDRTVGIDQRGASVIDWLPDDPDHVLMAVNMAQESNIGSNISAKAGGLSVQRVDVNSGRMTPVERANPAATAFDSDNQGRVRFLATTDRTATGYIRDSIRYFTRGKAGGDWRPLARDTISGLSAYTFLGFDESGDSILAARDRDGRAALFRDAVEPGGASELLFAHPTVDVDGVLRIGKMRRPVAAIYTTDSTEYAFFDKVLEKRSKALSSALAGKPPVYILDESWDGKRNLVFAGGVSDPGTFYRFDTTTKQLAALMPVRPAVSNRPAAVQSSVRYKAADGVEIPAYLTIPPGPAMANRPAIVMPHGGPSSRDQLGFDWLAQYFAQLGYVVLQPNFRGSAGYGEAWYAKNGFKSWETAIGDVNAGAKWLVSQGIADPQKLVIFGWSYGGYAALQANVVEPALYKAVIAVAPVTDLAQMKREAERYSNYPAIANEIGSGPHIAAGSPAQNAERFVAPVLMFHGDRDQNVDIEQARTMDSALGRAGKSHRLVVYPGLAHSLDDSGARTDMLKQSGEFLAKAIGG